MFLEDLQHMGNVAVGIPQCISKISNEATVFCELNYNVLSIFLACDVAW